MAPRTPHDCGGAVDRSDGRLVGRVPGAARGQGRRALAGGRQVDAVDLSVVVLAAVRGGCRWHRGGRRRGGRQKAAANRRGCQCAHLAPATGRERRRVHSSHRRLPSLLPRGLRAPPRGLPGLLRPLPPPLLPPRAGALGAAVEARVLMPVVRDHEGLPGWRAVAAAARRAARGAGGHLEARVVSSAPAFFAARAGARRRVTRVLREGRPAPGGVHLLRCRHSHCAAHLLRSTRMRLSLTFTQEPLCAPCLLAIGSGRFCLRSLSQGELRRLQL